MEFEDVDGNIDGEKPLSSRALQDGGLLEGFWPKQGCDRDMMYGQGIRLPWKPAIMSKVRNPSG